MADAERAQPDANWAKYRSAWWKRYFTGELAYYWPSQLDQSEPDKDDYRRMSRDDVFAIAATEAEHRELHTAVAAYVWGLGKNAYSIGRLVRAFTANVDTVENNLRLAASILTEDGAVAAYRSMLSGGRAKTKFMGPAYSTKFLFFVGYQSQVVTGMRPLILDKRVATALRSREGFGLKAGDSGWSSSLYERYLTYCQDENPGDPEAVEVELFIEGRAARPTPAPAPAPAPETMAGVPD
ncbi:hypothetical protein [Mycobacterium simiae]|uniref:8-oxoguanine DNA glycosylase OGG fold protein n=1 Tax=Mycobacterium simiae TaxID=1784 RepID=UPI0020CB68CF|nr:hypothetical protein [Mycobacterium simiae]